MNLGDLLKVFGIETLPDILYGLNSTSLTDFINKLAEIYEIDQKNIQQTYLNDY
jgi:hypothetical protein